MQSEMDFNLDNSVVPQGGDIDQAINVLEEEPETVLQTEDVLETVPADEKSHSYWNSSAARYEWQDSFGDVAPKVPELEGMLFGEAELRGSTGREFNK